MIVLCRMKHFANNGEGREGSGYFLQTRKEAHETHHDLRDGDKMPHRHVLTAWVGWR